MSRLSYKKSSVLDDKILYGPSHQTDFIENGLGERYFHTLDAFQDKIMQIDAITGVTETANSVKTRAIQIATELLRLDVTPNDIVAICCVTRMDQTVIVLGTLFIGTPLAVLDPDMTNQEFSRKITELKPKVLFCDPRIVAHVEKDKYHLYVMGNDVRLNSIKHLFTTKPLPNFVPVPVINPEKTTAFIILTEGTTGSPKLVSVSHAAAYIRTTKLINLLLKDVKKVVSYFPLMGTAQIMLICCSFETNIIRIVPKAFSEREACRIIHDLKVEVALLGTLYAKAIADYNANGQDFNINCLKRILIGGMVTSPAVSMYLNKIFPNVEILNVYSLAECGIIAGMTPENNYLGKAKPATLGTIFPAGKIKIVNFETRQSVGQDHWGELWYSGPDLALSYFGESPKEFLEKGYFKTGDIAQFDEQGCLYIYGRLDDKFDIEAHTFFAVDLESIFIMHSRVKDCIVSRNAGHLVIYAVVGDVGTRDLFKWLEQKVPPYMMPSMIYIVNDIPRTNNGKVKKYLMAKIVSRRSVIDSLSD